MYVCVCVCVCVWRLWWQMRRQRPTEGHLRRRRRQRVEIAFRAPFNRDLFDHATFVSRTSSDPADHMHADILDILNCSTGRAHTRV